MSAPDFRVGDEAAFVQTVSVTHPFQAPSLEEYLLGHLTTRHNSLGVASPVEKLGVEPGTALEP